MDVLCLHQPLKGRGRACNYKMKERLTCDQWQRRSFSPPLPTDRDLGSCCCQGPVPKLLRVGSWWPPTWGAAVGWTASPRMDTCMDSLRHEQPRLLRCCRHAAAASRHPPASELRACLLGRHLVDYNLVAARCSPTTSTRCGGSSAGDCLRSKQCLPLLWHAAVSLTHSCERLRRLARATNAATWSV